MPTKFVDNHFLITSYLLNIDDINDVNPTISIYVYINIYNAIAIAD